MNKGSGTLVILDINSHDKESGEKVVKNQISIFVVGESCPNGPRKSDLAIETKKKPNRAPDHFTDFKTSIDQVHLFLVLIKIILFHTIVTVTEQVGTDGQKNLLELNRNVKITINSLIGGS